MSFNPQKFINNWMGKNNDIDGVASYQCVDMWKQCLADVGYPNPTRPIGGSGGAKEIWNRRDALGYGPYFEYVQNMKFGDWCIWDGTLGGGYGHVAMFVKDNGDGTGQFFGQQQNYTHSPCSLNNISYAHTLGALRVKSKYLSNSTNVSSYSDSQLINESATIKLKYAINKRRDTPNGMVVETLPVGKIVSYTQKWVGYGHRYVSWVEHQADGASYRYFIAITGTEERGKDMWFEFVDDEQPSNPTPSQPSKPAEKPKVDYTKNVKGYGVDISEHNGENFDVSKYDFVIIRACYGENTDKLFETYVKKCENANIPYGVYCYDYALNDDEAKAEANYILELIKDKNVQLGVWFDMEDADGYKKKNGVLTKERCTSSCRAFCDVLKAHGYYTGVYTSSSWLNTYVETTYPLWVANWGSNNGEIQSDQSGVGVMHQYTSKPFDKDVIYHDIGYYKSNPIKVEEPQPEEPKDDDKEDTSTSNNMNVLIDLLITLVKKILSIFK